MKCHLTKAEAESKHVATQAKKDAQEDEAVTRGIASRLWHRFVEFI